MTELALITAGESHGPSLTAIVQGLPAGLHLQQAFVDAQLARRQGGHGRSARQRIETDRAQVTAGLRHGVTLGTPVAISIANRDHANWDAVMAAWPTQEQQENWRDRSIHVPRPGHADLGGIARGGFEDGLRSVLERASARETAARVAGGAFALAMLARLGIVVRAHVRAVGSASTAQGTPTEVDPRWTELDARAMRALDADDDARMVEEVDSAAADRDTLGGEIEVVAYGVPPGIGGYATSQERLDGRLAGALLSVHAMKSVAIGDGASAAVERGSAVHDEIVPAADLDPAAPVGGVGGDQGMGVTRRTNRSGGIEGGMSTGGPIVARVAMKPLPTLMRPLATVDLVSGDVAAAHAERSDTCAVPAAAVVLECALAFELARVIREQFGSMAMADVEAGWRAYCERVRYPHRPSVVLEPLGSVALG